MGVVVCPLGTEFPVKPALVSCRVGHLVQSCGIILHAVVIDFFRSFPKFELFFHRKHNAIRRWAVKGLVGRFVILYIGMPRLLLEHTVKGFVDIHPLGVFDFLFGCFETCYNGIIPLFIDLFKVGLVDVEDMKHFRERTNVHCGTLFLGHGVIVFL